MEGPACDCGCCTIVEVFGSPCGTNPTPSSCPRVGVRRHPLTVFTTRPGGDAMKRSMLVLAIAACAAIASPSTTSARLSDLTETRQAQPIMHSTIMDPTVGTFG